MNFRNWFGRRDAPAQSSAPAATQERPRRRHMQSMSAMVRAMESAFSASNTDRMTASWPAQPVPADWIIRKHQRILVARARQMATENTYAKAFVRMCRQNIVGQFGVQFQSQVRTSSGALDKPTNDAIEGAFSEWGKPKNCSVTGRKSLKTIQLSAVQALCKDGEAMLRKLYGAEAGPWGFALQELDPQRCPVDYDVDTPNKDGGFIRHGIEFNKYGRPLAYHFTVTDESELDYHYGGRAFIRIPADEIIHVFKDELGGQKRGLPWLATGLLKLRHIGATEDASVVNARVGAAKMGFIEWEDGKGPEFDEDDNLEIDAEAGVFPILPEGAKLNKWDPQYPSGEFSPFMKHVLRSTAAGWGVLYNNLANDLEGVNFSSIRQGTLDERERWKEDQEFLIEQLLCEIYEAWLPVALLSKRIKVKGQPLRAERIERYDAASWQPRRWTWIDPGADVKAAVDSKNNLLASPGSIIREQARDPSQVYREIAQDIEDMKAAGIPDEYIKLAFGQKLQPPPTDKKDAPPAE